MSYLLIGFDYKNIIKSEASRRVFLMNRVGDTALLGGIILRLTLYTIMPEIVRLQRFLLRI